MLTMAEKKPFQANVNGQPVALFRGYEDREAYVRANPNVDPLRVCLVAIALFHTRREREYIAASFFDEQGEEHWTKDFGKKEMMVWMGGVALDAEDQRVLHLANRNLGSVEAQFGWRPDVIVEWEPSEQEEEAYIQHELLDLDAAKGMPIEFLGDNEND